jgi:ribosomal protein S18 acetylase RimI-like enzyme
VVQRVLKSKNDIKYHNLIKKGFAKDYWLEQFLKKDCFVTNKPKNIKYLNKFKNIFIYFNLKKKLASAKLKKKNIRYLGKNVIFLKKITKNIIYDKKNFISYKIKQSRAERDKIINIAHRNFKYSRFHLDDRISKKIANLIKKKWVENFYRGKRGNKMIAQFYKKKLTGFCLIKYIDKNSALIDLICIDKKYFNQGLGKNLVNYTLFKLKLFNMSILMAGTQDSNPASINLYKSLGFKKKNVSNMYHFMS